MLRWKTVLSCQRNRMICFTSSLIRNLYHFATDFDRVSLQLLGTGIKNSLFKCKWAIGIWHSWCKHFNCWWKAVKNLIFYSCAFNVQLHVHLKKWTLKFKLLYLRNYISYFNNICRICCGNTHTKSESLAQIRTIMAEIQHFSRGLFFIGAPCTSYTPDVHAPPWLSLETEGSGTIRILLLFLGLRRFAYLVRGVRATGLS